MVECALKIFKKEILSAKIVYAKVINQNCELLTYGAVLSLQDSLTLFFFALRYSKQFCFVFSLNKFVDVSLEVC